MTNDEIEDKIRSSDSETHLLSIVWNFLDKGHKLNPNLLELVVRKSFSFGYQHAERCRRQDDFDIDKLRHEALIREIAELRNKLTAYEVANGR